MMRKRPDLDEIRTTLRKHKPELRERFGVVSLGVFGSWVRNEQTEQSDLDLLVDFDERPLSLLDVVAAENYLSDLLGVKVDLVERAALKPAIGGHILREVVAI